MVSFQLGDEKLTSVNLLAWWHVQMNSEKRWYLSNHLHQNMISFNLSEITYWCRFLHWAVQQSFLKNPGTSTIKDIKSAEVLNIKISFPQNKLIDW